MQVKVLQNDLSKALTTALQFVNARAQLPILSNIKITASKTKLGVSATNLETSVVIEIGAEVQKEGEIAVPARTITDLVSTITPGAFVLKVEKENLKINADGYVSTVSGTNTADFPVITNSVGAKCVQIDGNVFLEALVKTTFASSTDETRPVLTGVHVEFKGKFIEVVATDGFRLSKKKIVLKRNVSAKKIIIPRNALLQVMKLVKDVEVLVIGIKEKSAEIVFGMDGIVLSSRLLEGEFPDYEKIIPKSKEIGATLDKEEFLRAVKSASVFARDSGNIVKLVVKKDSVMVSAESKAYGSQESTVDAKVDGQTGKQGLEIAFNYRFLEEFLKSVGDEVVINLKDPNSPGVFTDPKDPNYLHLIMPVKLQS